MTMIRLHVTAEGQTEQAFVKKVLAVHLAFQQVYADARCVLTSKDKRAGKEFRGGLLSYQKAKADICHWMKEDRRAETGFTTMFDLYALPADFPGYAIAQHIADPYEKVRILEDALLSDIADPRFIPYVQLHEFEALIFANPEKLDWEYFDHDKPIRNLLAMVGNSNPELINDGFSTAPSKRIVREIPEYDKVAAGVSVVQKIGMEALRQKCRHFSEWVTKLERLAR